MACRHEHTRSLTFEERRLATFKHVFYGWTMPNLYCEDCGTYFKMTAQVKVVDEEAHYDAD